MITIKEQTVSFNQYVEKQGDSDIHIFVSGFEPSYSPVIVHKGQPETMKELKEKLENLLGVIVSFSAPITPKP